jgi:hypothetical protein
LSPKSRAIIFHPKTIAQSIPDESDGGDVPEVPDVPLEPTLDVPDVPDVPLDPTPEVPLVPDEPTPEVPEVPEVPEEPTPEVPDDPLDDEEPEEPLDPDVPELPTALVPLVPEDPEMVPRIGLENMTVIGTSLIAIYAVPAVPDDLVTSYSSSIFPFSTVKVSFAAVLTEISKSYSPGSRFTVSSGSSGITATPVVPDTVSGNVVMIFCRDA